MPKFIKITSLENNIKGVVNINHIEAVIAGEKSGSIFFMNSGVEILAAESCEAVMQLIKEQP